MNVGETALGCATVIVVEAGSGSEVGSAGIAAVGCKSGVAVATAIDVGCAGEFASSSASPQAIAAKLVEMTSAIKSAASLGQLSISGVIPQEKYAYAAVRWAAKA